MRSLVAMKPLVHSPLAKTNSSGVAKRISVEERAIEELQAITAYYSKQRREPLPNRANIEEYNLFIKLQNLHHNHTKNPSLSRIDHFDLLNGQSLNDVGKIRVPDTAGPRGCNALCGG